MEMIQVAQHLDRHIIRVKVWKTWLLILGTIELLLCTWIALIRMHLEKLIGLYIPPTIRPA